MKRITTILTILSILLAGCYYPDDPPSSSSRPVDPGWSADDSFVMTVQQEVPVLRGASDRTIINLGHDACEAVERTQPRDLDELVLDLMAASMDAQEAEDLVKITAAAIVHYCPEWERLAQ